jgi:hypothetical protein
MSQVDDSLSKRHQASRGAKPPQTASQPGEKRRIAIILCQRPVAKRAIYAFAAHIQYGNAQTVRYGGGQ